MQGGSKTSELPPRQRDPLENDSAVCHRLIVPKLVGLISPSNNTRLRLYFFLLFLAARCLFALPFCLCIRPIVSIFSSNMKRKASSQSGPKRTSSKRSKSCKSSPPVFLLSMPVAQTADQTLHQIQPSQNPRPSLASAKVSSSRMSWTPTPRATLNRPPISTASSTA